MNSAPSFPAAQPELSRHRIVVLTGAEDDFDGTHYIVKEFSPFGKTSARKSPSIAA